MATGSSLFLRKFRPFSGTPAGIEERTSGCALAGASFFADGVSGSEKGCAADVDVAAGGVCEESGEPCRGAVCVAVLGEMGVALRWEGDVER
jgi:hypothetical protein